MAEATAPGTRSDDAIVLPMETTVGVTAPALLAHKRVRFIIWAGFALFIVGFLSLGTVRVGAGNWIGRRMSIVRIWQHFVDFLADKGAAAPLIAGVAVVALFAVLGAIYLLWLAFGLRDDFETNDPTTRTTGD